MTDIAKHAATLSLALLCLPAYPANKVSDVLYLLPPSEKAAEVQQSWWAVIKDDAQMSKPKLLDALSTSPPGFFSKSCAQPLIPGDYERLRDAFADIMLSGVPGENQQRGRFLACLQNSGLDALKSNIETAFMRKLMSRFEIAPLVTCRWRDDALAASATNLDRRIYWHQPSTHSRLVALSPHGFVRVPMTFRNTALHELVHLGGIGDEERTTSIVGCCGEQSEFREESCKALDATVSKDKTVFFFDKRLDGYSTLKLYAKGLGDKDLLRVGRRFYDVLIDRLGGAKAAENSNEKILAATKSSLDAVFPSQCRDLVAEQSVDACDTVDAPVKEKMLGYMKLMLARP